MTAVTELLDRMRRAEAEIIGVCDTWRLRGKGTSSSTRRKSSCTASLRPPTSPWRRRGWLTIGGCYRRPTAHDPRRGVAGLARSRSGVRAGRYTPRVDLQSDALNVFLRTVVVLPFTTNPRWASFPFCVAVPAGEGGLVSDSVVLCHQIRVVDKSRLSRRLGQVAGSIMTRVGPRLAVRRGHIASSVGATRRLATRGDRGCRGGANLPYGLGRAASRDERGPPAHHSGPRVSPPRLCRTSRRIADWG